MSEANVPECKECGCNHFYGISVPEIVLLQNPKRGGRPIKAKRFQARCRHCGLVTVLKVPLQEGES